MGKKIINRDYFNAFYTRLVNERSEKFGDCKYIDYASKSDDILIGEEIIKGVEKISNQVIKKAEANGEKKITDDDIKELILTDDTKKTNLYKTNKSIGERFVIGGDEKELLANVRYDVTLAVRDKFNRDLFGTTKVPTSMGKIVDKFNNGEEVFLDEWNNAKEDVKKVLDEGYKEYNFKIDEILKNIQEPKFADRSFIMDLSSSFSQSSISRSVSRSLSIASGCFGIKRSHSKDSSAKNVEDMSNILGPLKEKLATEHHDGEPAQENTAEQQPNNMEASTSDEIVRSELAEENVVNPKDVQNSAEIPTIGVSTISKEARELYNSIMEEVKASREYSGEDEDIKASRSGEDEDMYDILALLEGGGGNGEVQGENEQPKPAQKNTKRTNYSLGNMGTYEDQVDMYELDDIASTASGETNGMAEHQEPAQENMYHETNGNASRNSEVDSNVSMSNEINMLEEQSQQDVDIQNITNELQQLNNMEASTSDINEENIPTEGVATEHQDGEPAQENMYHETDGNASMSNVGRRLTYESRFYYDKEKGVYCKNTSPKLIVPKRNASKGLNMEEWLAMHAERLMTNEGQIGTSNRHYSIKDNPDGRKIELSFKKVSNPR